MVALGLGLSTAESEATAPRPATVTLIQAVPGADVGDDGVVAQLTLG
jgi:hypothetical protein